LLVPVFTQGVLNRLARFQEASGTGVSPVEDKVSRQSPENTGETPVPLVPLHIDEFRESRKVI